MLHRLATLALFCGLAFPLAAGPFDDLSHSERADFRAEVRAYLLENPEVLMEAIAILEARQAEATAIAEVAALEQYHTEIFDDGVSFIAGNPDGDITIVEFLDYQCSFCKRAHPEIAELLAIDGNIRLVQKEYPVLGPMSEAAARAAQAVLLNDGADAYAAFSDRLMTYDGPLNDGLIIALARDSGIDTEAMIATARGEKVSGIIRANRILGQALEITGTPTFIIMDEFVRGYMPLPQLQELVAGKRAEM